MSTPIRYDIIDRHTGTKVGEAKTRTAPTVSRLARSTLRCRHDETYHQQSGGGLIHMPNIDVSVTWTPAGFYAIDLNTYDCDCDQDGYFSNSPQGYGPTPLDAIIDLLDNMEG